MNNTAAIITALENTPSILIPLVREVPAENLRRRPEAGKWSVHEHVCHLADVHQLMLSRLDLMLSQDNPPLVPFFPSSEDDALLKVDLEEALERFNRDRQGIVARLKELTAEQWQRTAVHGQYSQYSIFIMCRHMAMHDMLHAYRIEDLLLKKDWA